jgi:putative transposase
MREIADRLPELAVIDLLDTIMQALSSTQEYGMMLVKDQMVTGGMSSVSVGNPILDPGMVDPARKHEKIWIIFQFITNRKPENTGVHHQELQPNICPGCPSHHDRDIDAAINILQERLRSIAAGPAV